MKLRYIYLVIAILGVVLPLSQFVPASLAGQFSVGQLIADITANRNVAGLTLDLTVAVVAGLVFMIAEAVRMRIRLVWIPIIGSFLIGFSFGLPFFLFLRELRLAKELGVAENRPGTGET
ncbi:MAG: DUF2834 domain-containing protein [bacterium]